MEQLNAQLIPTLKAARVVPVIVIHELAHAIPLAQALVAGGIRVLEVTLRTPVALKAIEMMQQVEGAIVGAGTVLTPGQLSDVQNAGGKFAVSPGLTEELARAADTARIGWLPGVVTPSEVMQARSYGLRFLKFFPASAYGGTSTLKALGSVFGDITFCPTGGISLDTAPEYLGLGNVTCIGGSWLTPAKALEQGDWVAITGLAQQASRSLNISR